MKQKLSMAAHNRIAFLKETSERAFIMKVKRNKDGAKITTVKVDRTGEIKNLGPNELVILGEVQFTK